MSYSFNVRAASAMMAMAAVAGKLDEIVAQQPVHEADRHQALAAVDAFVALVPLPEGREYSISVNGSIGKAWVDGGPVGDPLHVSVGVNVSTVDVAQT